MDDMEKAISERQEKIRQLEKELDQVQTRLIQAQQELGVLLAARQIVSQERILGHFSGWSADQLSFGTTNMHKPINTDRILSMEARNAVVHGTHSATFRVTPNGIEPVRTRREREMTLVDEVKATLCNSPVPLGPSEIRQELARAGRDVPQNVMTGVLSRLAKEHRVVRLERGKYASTEEERIGRVDPFS